MVMEFKEDDGVIVTAPGYFPRIGVVNRVYTISHPVGDQTVVVFIGADGVEYRYYADELIPFP
jgi:hypothetical protein